MLTATLLSACTSHRAHEPERDVDSGSEQEPPMVDLATPPVPWRWIHRGGEGGWFADIGPKTIHAGGFECSYQHDDEAHTLGQVCCEGPKRWCVEMREAFVPGIALVSDGQRLFVADYPAISSGARFAAYTLESGAMLWSRDALAIGPQAHSEYSNVVQLRLVDGTLIAYGDEAHGAYVEVMDPATGASLHHTTREHLRVGWSWSVRAPEPEPTVTLALADGRECRFEAPEQGPTTLSCMPDGAPAWARVVEGDFVGRGALVSDGERVVAITWSRIASGSRARAWALADGALLWDRAIEGLGPQDHSKYSNLILLGLEGELLIVRGLESHGRYVEALDVTTGALLWTVSWPDF
ncbi:MAG TPA: hypothetical protein VM869_05350 [Enhygromyxa sp.]|nr:hypothetical protein [Enhygromyxa sp.]